MRSCQNKRPRGAALRGQCVATGWTTWLRLPTMAQILSRLSLGPKSKHGVQLVRGRKCLELHLHFLLRLH